MTWKTFTKNVHAAQVNCVNKLYPIRIIERDTKKAFSYETRCGSGFNAFQFLQFLLYTLKITKYIAVFKISSSKLPLF
jgi:hypothetical protein